MTIKTLIATAALVAAVASSASAQDLRATSAADHPDQIIGRTPADTAAAHSAGTVGAMHYAVNGAATNAEQVRRQSPHGLTAAQFTWRTAAGS